MNSVSTDRDDKVEIVGQDLLTLVKTKSYGYIVSSMLLGKPVKSKELVEASDFILKLLVDHGPYVSGAVNTMISARAGKDLVSSLVSGLLTIGPRFGGAINMAATHWFEGVTQGIDPYEYVETIAAQKKLISGIGHRKYRVDFPDPRVKEILAFTDNLKRKSFTNFALTVQKITTAKKGNLILNVDGAIAAVLLDILSEKEGLANNELKELIDTEFFNAYFVLSRAVGFTAHYLDQRRLDEGLFRLSPNEVSYAAIPKASK
jgi:citrate synthase